MWGPGLDGHPKDPCSPDVTVVEKSDILYRVRPSGLHPNWVLHSRVVLTGPVLDKLRTLAELDAEILEALSV